MSAKEIAESPPAANDAARVRAALAMALELRGVVSRLPTIAAATASIEGSLRAFSERLDALEKLHADQFSRMIGDRSTFKRLPVEADIRDVEVATAAAVSVSVHAWRQVIGVYASVEQLRRAIMETDGADVDQLKPERRVLFDRLCGEEDDRLFLGCDDRLRSITGRWRDFRDRQAAGEDAPEALAGAPADIAAAE